MPNTLSLQAAQTIVFVSVIEMDILGNLIQNMRVYSHTHQKTLTPWQL